MFFAGKPLNLACLCIFFYFLLSKQRKIYSLLTNLISLPILFNSGHDCDATAEWFFLEYFQQQLSSI